MAKKEKTPLPDDGSDTLITVLSIAAAFVASVTLALIVGVALQYKSTTAAIIPEEAASSQQVTQPVKGQASQTDIEKDDISKPSGSEYVPDGSEPAGGPAGEPEDSEEPPQENVPPQTDTPSALSTQTPNSNSGASTNKADPPKSSGTTPSNPNSGTNSGSTVTIKPNQPKTVTPNSKPNISDNTIVYVSNASNTIHSIPDCSNMKNYREMSKSQADANEYEYCKNCW